MALTIHQQTLVTIARALPEAWADSPETIRAFVQEPHTVRVIRYGEPTIIHYAFRVPDEDVPVVQAMARLIACRSTRWRGTTPEALFDAAVYRAKNCPA